MGSNCTSWLDCTKPGELLGSEDRVMGNHFHRWGRQSLLHSICDLVQVAAHWYSLVRCGELSRVHSSSCSGVSCICCRLSVCRLGHMYRFPGNCTRFCWQGKEGSHNSFPMHVPSYTQGEQHGFPFVGLTFHGVTHSPDMGV